MTYNNTTSISRKRIDLQFRVTYKYLYYNHWNWGTDSMVHIMGWIIKGLSQQHWFFHRDSGGLFIDGHPTIMEGIPGTSGYLTTPTLWQTFYITMENHHVSWVNQRTSSYGHSNDSYIHLPESIIIDRFNTLLIVFISNEHWWFWLFGIYVYIYMYIG